jgi:prefoldin subunit 5
MPRPKSEADAIEELASEISGLKDTLEKLVPVLEDVASNLSSVEGTLSDLLTRLQNRNDSQ